MKWVPGCGIKLLVSRLSYARMVNESLEPSGLCYDKPLCASLDGFTLHAATRAEAMDRAGSEALMRYVLRPPIAQQRVVPQKSGLVAITLKRAYADGTVAVEMDRCRFCVDLR